jgi:hypothetical protein
VGGPLVAGWYAVRTLPGSYSLLLQPEMLHFKT